MLVFILLKNMIKAGSADSQEEKYNKKDLVIGGICCGIILFVAGTLQQLGIDYGAAVGKAGFLTACYILIGPDTRHFPAQKMWHKCLDISVHGCCGTVSFVHKTKAVSSEMRYYTALRCTLFCSTHTRYRLLLSKN